MNMKYLERPRKKNNILIIWGLALFAVLMVSNTVRVYILARGAEVERKDIADKLAGRELKIKDLEAKLKSLETGEGVEFEARTRLNLQKPDERVLIIVDDKNATAEIDAQKKESILSWIKRWSGFNLLYGWVSGTLGNK